MGSVAFAEVAGSDERCCGAFVSGILPVYVDFEQEMIVSCCCDASPAAFGHG
jgi:hypothetical protein